MRPFTDAIALALGIIAIALEHSHYLTSNAAQNVILLAIIIVLVGH